MIAKLRFFTLSTALLASAAFSRADLLIDPAGGNVLWDDSSYHGPDSIIDGTTALSGQFFGLPFDGWTPTISINGNINFSENADTGGSLGSEFRSRIAPLWTGLVLEQDSGGRVVETIGDGYYAVSWLDLNSEEGSGSFSFQGIFFTEETTLGGITFQAYDIVFAYSTLGSLGYERLLSVGLEVYVEEYSIGNHATFGNEYGTFDDSTMEGLPTAPGEYVLFRPDGLGGYDVSIETSAVPEPSAFAALAGFFTLAVALLRRRRAA